MTVQTKPSWNNAQKKTVKGAQKNRKETPYQPQQALAEAQAAPQRIPTFEELAEVLPNLTKSLR